MNSHQMGEHRSAKTLNNYLINRQYASYSIKKQLDLAKGSLRVLTSMKSTRRLTGHNGCVNCLCWSDDGTLLLSGSDDKYLNIYDMNDNFELKYHINSGHTHNIFNAKFMPCSNNSKVVSCCCNSGLFYTEIDYPDYYGQNSFKCHNSIPYDVVVANDEPYSFFVCAQEGTVRHYDIREKINCKCKHCTKDVIVRIDSGISSMDICQSRSYEIVTGSYDSIVRIFDRRMCRRPDHIINGNSSYGQFFYYKRENQSSHFNGITSLYYNDSGSEILISYVGDEVHLISCNASSRPDNNLSWSFSDSLFSRKSYFEIFQTSSESLPDTESIQTFEDNEIPQVRRSSRVLKKMRLAQDPEQLNPQYVHIFKGHSNVRTMLKDVSFWGKRFIMSGSDCGRIFVWDRQNENRLVLALKADNSVVNVIKPHPFKPMFVTSGIDYNIKLFYPTAVDSNIERSIRDALAENSDFLHRDTLASSLNFVEVILPNLPGNYERYYVVIPDFSDDSGDAGDTPI